MLVLHEPSRLNTWAKIRSNISEKCLLLLTYLISPDRNRGRIERTVNFSDLFEDIAISGITREEKPVLWADNSPTAPQNLIVVGYSSLTPVLGRSEDKRH